MGFGDAIKAGFNNYGNFKGRATRPEFWWFWLFCVLILGVAQIPLSIAVNGLFDDNPNTGLGVGTFAFIYFVVWVVLFIPLLAVLVRRLHDSDKSGWWVLIGILPLIGTIVLFIFAVTPSQPARNQYGAPQVGS